jgi:DNA repair exonuclease SbcCD ATPase subunit
MLTFNKLKWSDAFSYGENNEIDFRKHPLVQIVAKNGSGKTSIGLILEEVLFNKNSKNIKKSDILNRYSKKSKYRIAIDFEKDGNTYTVDTVRGTTQSVILTCNGVDISEHTSTGTYKAIEKILGYNHKTFTQVCNVSDPFCLEFLTTTDSKRKEFLIDLLKLSEYTDIYNSIKALTVLSFKILERNFLELQTR